MVRALASHQCGPGSIPGLGVICGLSLLLVLVLAPRGISPGTLVFPSPKKTNTSKFQFDLESVPNWCSELNTLTLSDLFLIEFSFLIPVFFLLLLFVSKNSI